MDAARRQRIKDSFNALAPHGEALVNRFYERLFSEHPAVRPMFPDDMGQQKKHLLASLALIVKNIDNFAALEQPLKKLGARHLAYGARPEHYPVVGGTLLAVMGELAGSLWTDQLREDWTAAVNAIAQTMLAGTAEAERFRAAA
jgi:hemoglobin-like flavoprotein